MTDGTNMASEKAHRTTKPPLALYANYFEVGHNQCEFLIDFGQYRPESADVVLHTRIVLGPAHAKLLTGILQGAVRQYEAENGAIAELADSLDPMEVVRRSLPNFDRRAVETRRKAAELLVSTSKPRTHQKR
jgi:hypothetical protein